MQGYALHGQGIEVVASDLLQEAGGARHQVGYAARHATVYHVIGVGANIDKFGLARFGLLAVAHGAHAPTAGCHYLNALNVGEALVVAVYAPDGMVGGDGCRLL